MKNIDQIIAGIAKNSGGVPPTKIMGYVSGKDEEQFRDYLIGRKWEDIDCCFWKKSGRDLFLLFPQAIAYYFPSLVCCSLKGMSPPEQQHSASLISGLFDEDCESAELRYLSAIKASSSQELIGLFVMAIDLIKSEFQEAGGYVDNLEFAGKYLKGTILSPPKRSRAVLEMYAVIIGDSKAYKSWIKVNGGRLNDVDKSILEELSLEMPIGVKLEEEDIEDLVECLEP